MNIDRSLNPESTLISIEFEGSTACCLSCNLSISLSLSLSLSHTHTHTQIQGPDANANIGALRECEVFPTGSFEPRGAGTFSSFEFCKNQLQYCLNNHRKTCHMGSKRLPHRVVKIGERTGEVCWLQHSKPSPCH